MTKLRKKYWMRSSAFSIGSQPGLPQLYLIALNLRLIICDFGRKAVCGHIQPMRLFDRLMMFGENSRGPNCSIPSAKSVSAKGQFKRQSGALGDIIKQADIFEHKIHGEIDIPAAIQITGFRFHEQSCCRWKCGSPHSSSSGPYCCRRPTGLRPETPDWQWPDNGHHLIWLPTLARPYAECGAILVRYGSITSKVGRSQPAKIEILPVAAR